MKHAYLVFLVFCSTFLFAQAQSFRLVSYNSLRYSPNNIDGRHPDLRMIMNDLQPDVLCVQEFSGLGSALTYKDSVLNVDSTTYSLASFTDANDLDIALYYKTARFTEISALAYPTTLRAIYHFQLVPIGTPDTLHIFGVHLKASTGSANQQARRAEVDTLRKLTDQLPQGANFIVCGDFNIYGANEPAYTRLLQDTPNNDGHFVDQFTMPGTWNNPAYASYHTQSPRTTRFNGGANGGMDDRFDMILMSETLDDTTGWQYVPGSMFAYGNDGLHYNNAINAPPTNVAVGQAMADALHYASDHIPVVAQFKYTSPSTGYADLIVEDVDVFTTPNGVVIHNPRNQKLSVMCFDMGGRKLLDFECSSTQVIQIPGAGLAVIRLQTDHGFLNKLIVR